MEDEAIKTKILADYQTLIAIRFDSPLVIYDKLKLISERIAQLSSTIPEEQENYVQAATLIRSAMDTEYVTFSKAETNDQKEQTLAELKHKAAEACQRLTIRG